MILDLDKLSSDVERISGDEVVRFEDVSGAERRIDCHVDADVRRIGETFYVHVAVTGVLATDCHRCLEPARYEVRPSFDLVIRRESAGTPSREHEPAPDDEDFIGLPRGENEFELDGHIYESVVVDIPMRIVCDEGCKGLCSGCGANLNREECRCSAAPDPRWEGLRKLRNSASD